MLGSTVTCLLLALSDTADVTTISAPDWQKKLDEGAKKTSAGSMSLVQILHNHNIRDPSPWMIGALASASAGVALVVYASFHPDSDAVKMYSSSQHDDRPWWQKDITYPSTYHPIPV